MFKTVALQQNMRGDVSCVDMVRGGVLLLGGFDGLHIGHRQLLARAKAYGLPVGVMTIVGGKEGSLFTLSERELIFKNAGVDFVFELPFAEIKELSPKQFIALLEEQFAPKAIVCGADFRFGAGAKGNAESLKTLSSAEICVLPLLEVDGRKVSSSTVKALLSDGALEQANGMLGEPFFLLGEVEQGRQIGRTIGFPTANIAYREEKFALPLGVYESTASVDGVAYKSITNFGAQPTVQGGQVCVETYLDGFEGDLYGKKLQIRFIRKIRNIKKFESLELLKAQLQADLDTIR